jgi:hypothetical protein
MTTFAKVEKNIVTQVINADAEFFETFVDSTPGDWIETGLNIRKQYAGIGYTYDETNDVFIEPQPFPSWTLDSDHDWQPPTAKPDDGKVYNWNEDTQAWDEME